MMKTRAGDQVVEFVLGQIDKARKRLPVITNAAERGADVSVTQVVTMEQIVSHSLASRRSSMAFVGLFAALVLVLAAIGISGVVRKV